MNAEQNKSAETWFSYVIADRKLWCHGFTLNRLEKIKPHVFSDKDIMWDLLKRHDGENLSPQQMKEADYHRYRHCIDNFVCSILNKMMQHNMIKAYRK